MNFKGISLFGWSQKCNGSGSKIGYAKPDSEVFAVVDYSVVVQNTGNSSGFAGDGRALRSCCLLTETGANAYFISLLQEVFRS